jgi:hypothetical protein
MKLNYCLETFKTCIQLWRCAEGYKFNELINLGDRGVE